jgi:hypothetical protein
MPGITSELKQYGAVFALISPNLGQMTGTYNGLRAGVSGSRRLIFLVESRSQSPGFHRQPAPRTVRFGPVRRCGFDGQICDETNSEL